MSIAYFATGDRDLDCLAALACRKRQFIADHRAAINRVTDFSRGWRARYRDKHTRRTYTPHHHAASPLNSLIPPILRGAYRVLFCQRFVLARHGHGHAGLAHIALLELPFVLLHHPFETSDVLQQALAGQTEQVVSEFRILEVKLEQRFIRNGEDVAVFEALNRLRPPVLRRSKTELAHNTPGRQLNA